MPTDQERQAQLDQLVALLSADDRIVAVVLVGSMAGAKTVRWSDVGAGHMGPLRTRSWRAPAILAGLLLAACASAPVNGTPPTRDAAESMPDHSAEQGAPTPDVTPSGSPLLTSEALRDAVGADAIHAHLEQLQRIADEHDGSRAAETPGYDASVEYVAGRLEAAGYVVEQATFQLPPGQGTSVNVIAQLPGGDDSEVVMLGAHLDSTSVGPGINDNGSGVMTLLVLAEQLAEFDRPMRTVRFAFWGAEELGQVGSAAYMASLDSAERLRLTAYLNFDMVGSPNYVRFVYDDQAAAPGSAAITQLFASHFETEGLAWEPIDLAGKSDHGPFSLAGIATGGTFSGGRENKTDAQAAAFGGTAGEPADPCSHRACDTIANISDEVLEQMADAIAHALITLAGS
jgi:aminopeptidase S